jgi:NADPH-dependent 2,4-dienoyl-CoA reductase/sulfur reductase-like enzyme
MTATGSQCNVAVAGAGLMGCGIASVFALAGFDVVVYDAAPSALNRIPHCRDLSAEGAPDISLGQRPRKFGVQTR